MDVCVVFFLAKISHRQNTFAKVLRQYGEHTCFRISVQILCRKAQIDLIGVLVWKLAPSGQAMFSIGSTIYVSLTRELQRITTASYPKLTPMTYRFHNQYSKQIQ